MKMYEYVRNEYEAYTGELRADIWWAHEGFRGALLTGLCRGLELTEEDFAVFEQQGYRRDELVSLLSRATDKELATTTGSYELLSAYAMREWRVDPSVARDLAYSIDMLLREWKASIDFFIDTRNTDN